MTSRRTALLLRGLIAVALLAALLAGGRSIIDRLPEFAMYIQRLGLVGALVFIVVYALATVAFVPGSFLTLAAGAIFGLVHGVVLVFAGASLGSVLAFLVARYLARPSVERRLVSNARFAALDRAVAAEGRRIVLLLRLSPVFPFSFLNYALGVTRISLVDYAVAGVGMLPGTVLYVYYGKLAGDVASVAGRLGAPKDASYYAVLAVGLIATLLATTVGARIARSALRNATEGTAI